MNRKTLSINSTVLLWVSRMIVVMTGVFLMGDGCKNPVTSEQLQQQIAGTWELALSSNATDSVYIHKVILVLKKDSTFFCTASFFLKDDSTHSQTMVGTWQTGVPPLFNWLSEFPNSNTIELSSDTSSRVWEVIGDATSKEMTWYREDKTKPTYTWDIVQ